MENILFLPLDINPPSQNVIETTISKLDKIPLEEMFQDDYRNCFHVNLLKANGEIGVHGDGFSEILDWYKSEIIPWAKQGRVMIIVTPPHTKNHIHVDCSPEKFLSDLQHKFRYVLQGKTSSLAFYDGDDVIKPEDINYPFVMSGKWPHDMNNNFNQRKYTFALGYPWEPKPKEDKNYRELLERSLSKYRKQLLSANFDKIKEIQMSLFEEKYTGGYTPDWHRKV